ncbi:MAG: FKBP-type peptidyl-prolyl cis-trans isomerase [Gemmataceae bacterium]|nr:FKBP-type peptidyl-prolyl cis-trans isomerase [Gemmata sp.]MDW8197342.1 FKBP-type peptidyl-prolyl cis-trans isomerase [Gemmataceae bacterium]
MGDTQGVDRATMKQYLVPAAGVAAIVVLVGLVLLVSGNSERTMSDGSNGSAQDPDLRDISPGVKYRDIKEGTGDPCPPQATIVIHYTGWLSDGTVFDSTKEGKAVPTPATFELKNLIAGWKEGIPGMKPGGIRKLVIAPDKGYGSIGSPPKIPGGATLIFEVELISFTAAKDLTKLADGTAPGDNDPNLREIRNTGVKYRDIKEGLGAPVQPGAKVKIHYTGWLLDGKVFDSSHRRGEPAEFALNGLIKGWQEGIPGMKPGGIRKLVIPPEMGYGAQGAPPDIPPNATLVFEVELIE